MICQCLVPGNADEGGSARLLVLLSRRRQLGPNLVQLHLNFLLQRLAVLQRQLRHLQELLDLQLARLARQE